MILIYQEITDTIFKLYLETVDNLCDITNINRVPKLFITDSSSVRSGVSAGYLREEDAILLIQDKLEWQDLPKIISHEWWHAVQWERYPRLFLQHESFLSVLNNRSDAALLEDLSPLEVEARMFERRRQGTDHRYLLRHKNDYATLLSGDQGEISQIYRRLKDNYPYVL